MNTSNRQTHITAVENPDRESLAARVRAAFRQDRGLDCFYPARDHREALESMSRLITEGDKSAGMLTSAPGCGKTLLRKLLHKRLAAQGTLCVSLESGLLDFDSLLLEIISQMEQRRIMPAEMPDRYSRIACFKDSLVRNVVGQGRKLALLLDEAQQLDRNTIEGIRSLTNIDSDDANFVIPLFFGHPELAGIVQAVPAMASRLAWSGRLDRLDHRDSVGYVQARLAAAGVRLDIDPEAMNLLHQRCGGMPRALNSLCRDVLGAAVLAGETTVTAERVNASARPANGGGQWAESSLLPG